jgi:hypothetical protein
MLREGSVDDDNLRFASTLPAYELEPALTG